MLRLASQVHLKTKVWSTSLLYACRSHFCRRKVYKAIALDYILITISLSWLQRVREVSKLIAHWLLFLVVTSDPTGDEKDYMPFYSLRAVA